MIRAKMTEDAGLGAMEQECIKKMIKAAIAEKKLGYTDAAAFGGFANFMLHYLRELRQLGTAMGSREALLGRLEELFALYTHSVPSGRQLLLQEAAGILEQIGAITDSNLASNKVTPMVASGPRLSEPARNLKGVGPQMGRILHKLGINTVEELLYHIPRRYEDRRQIKNLSSMIPGNTETVHGKILAVDVLAPRRGLTVTKAAISDGTMIAYAVWFNQPYMKQQLKKESDLLVTGKVRRNFGTTEIMVVDYEVLDGRDSLHGGRIVPVYPLTEEVGQRRLRSVIYQALQSSAPLVQDLLPAWLRVKYQLMGTPDALWNIHYPGEMRDQERARRTLAFEELFLFQLGLQKFRRIKRADTGGIAHKGAAGRMEEFIRRLPFALTGAQRRVLKDVLGDMGIPRPMSRLLQGDVGSGKTIVAVAALYQAVISGYQSALMVPTEILAEQHYLTIRDLLHPLGVRVELLVSGMPRSEREDRLECIREGTAQVIVGTQALIQEKVQFASLGLVVIDEQHRFGVRQRSSLQQKGSVPDVLVMTATPIPRTLALTLYGDLDLSVIDELPPGRRQVITRFYPEKKRGDVYELIRQELGKGRQAYVVCPLVEESEILQVEAAVQMAERLQEEVFPQHHVGLMHGRLKMDEKESVMTAFRRGEIQVLVATTVVEVGVDVPNASVMLIEGAERFGLAQLHQLRGRVGRGPYASYCMLLGKLPTPEARGRIAVMTKTNDGFVIAEEDLKLRGPGEFFGTKQHGLPELRVANLVTDADLLETARMEARDLLLKDPDLRKPEDQLLLGVLKDRFMRLEP
ncbi:MAG: ATP-dependent DNA helicase RecG [Bacillota bacterium]